MPWSNKVIFACAGIGLLFWLPLTQAEDTDKQLQRFFAGLRTLSADFEQRVTDTDGALIQQSQGHLWLQRPGRFRWDYQLPYHQLIVGDGEQVWVYDEDLEQVSVRHFDASLGQTPALLLSSDKPLLESFSVIGLGHREGIDWVQLLPREQETAFEELRLGLVDGGLRFMELRDGLGHITLLSFSKLRRNGPVDAQLFVFVPPAGVDVVRDDGRGFGQQDE